MEDTYWGKANDPLSLNFYIYCVNNPIIFIDPSGNISVISEEQYLMDQDRENGLYADMIEINNGNSFVSIDSQYNGGNQHWFDSAQDGFTLSVSAGCGTVAAANLIADKAFSNPSGYGGLVSFTEGNVTKKDYLDYMISMYDYVQPLARPFTGGEKPMGVISVEALKVGIELYAEDKGIFITTDKLVNASFRNSADFIRNKIENNTPVGMLIWFNSNMEAYSKHWMTITGIVENSSNGDVYVKVSTWGKIERLSLNDLYYSPNAINYFGLVTVDRGN